MEKTLVIASNNKGKIAEIRRIVEKAGWNTVSAKEIGIDGEAEENGKSFEENAEIKAGYVMKRCKRATIADDSGLCVDALNGAPGIYSARYAPGTDDDRIDKLLSELRGVEDRTARFVSVICCLFPNGEKIVVRGECEGKIAFERHGTGGFGYDPIFISELGAFGELTAEQKDSISHRGKALEKFKEEFLKRNDTL